MTKQDKQLPAWTNAFTNKVYNSVEDFEEDTIGFVYIITFMDGTKYIGKKALYTELWTPRQNALKAHPKAVRSKACNTGEGHRRIYDLIIREGPWKTYKGSSKETAVRTPIKREVLYEAKSNRELTYLEAKALFQYNVLEIDLFLNSNILGKFFRNNLK